MQEIRARTETLKRMRKQVVLPSKGFCLLEPLSWWMDILGTFSILSKPIFSVKTAPFTRCCAKRYSGAKRGYSAVTECAELRACAVGKGF